MYRLSTSQNLVEHIRTHSHSLTHTNTSTKNKDVADIPHILSTYSCMDICANKYVYRDIWRYNHTGIQAWSLGWCITAKAHMKARSENAHANNMHARSRKSCFHRLEALCEPELPLLHHYDFFPGFPLGDCSLCGCKCSSGFAFLRILAWRLDLCLPSCIATGIARLAFDFKDFTAAKMSLLARKSGFWLRTLRLFLEFRPRLPSHEEESQKDGSLRNNFAHEEAGPICERKIWPFVPATALRNSFLRFSCEGIIKRRQRERMAGWAWGWRLRWVRKNSLENLTQKGQETLPRNFA